MTTEHARIRFIVKECGDGKPWIAVELYDHGISWLSSGIFGFDLKKGASIETAREVAELLNRNVIEAGYTPLPK